MIPLKFRAWDIRNKKMWDVFRMGWDFGSSIPTTVIVGYAEKGSAVTKPLHNLPNQEPEFVLIQYTGRKDNDNFLEIYADDIMNFKTDKSSPSGGHYAGTVGFHPENARVVEWVDDGWMVGGFRLSTQLRMYEVIGNIHQHPELLDK